MDVKKDIYMPCCKLWTSGTFLRAKTAEMSFVSKVRFAFRFVPEVTSLPWMIRAVNHAEAMRLAGLYMAIWVGFYNSISNSPRLMGAVFSN